jgi:hypothetical protein
MKKLAALAAVLLMFSLPAAARSWHPAGRVLAQDYLVITDDRPGHDIALVFWMAWPLVDNAPTMVRELLDKYVVLGVAHGRVDVGGKMVFDKEESATAASLNGGPLKLLNEANYPPAVAGAVATLGGFMRQSMGALGEGMKFLVFESGDVRACEKGQLSVTYSGETYTYDTPIPGCPKP